MSKTRGPKRARARKSTQECLFCKEKKSPSFEDTQTLQKFLTERGKIIGRMRSGLCSKHQKDLAREIKYARHLAFLPFVSR